MPFTPLSPGNFGADNDIAYGNLVLECPRYSYEHQDLRAKLSDYLNDCCGCVYRARSQFCDNYPPGQSIRRSEMRVFAFDGVRYTD